MEALFSAFPGVSYEIMREYLFGNTVSAALIQTTVKRTGVNKISVGNSKGKKLEGIIYERAAFIAWAGGDWEGYLREALATAKKKEAETVAKLRQSRKDFVIAPWRNKDTHTQNSAPAEDTHAQNSAPAEDQGKDEQPSSGQMTHEHARKKHHQRPERLHDHVRRPIGIAEDAARVQAIAEMAGKSSASLNATGFKAIIEVSTPVSRSRIEELIVHILNNMPAISLDSYEITRKE
jgi:hypothetical protein